MSMRAEPSALPPFNALLEGHDTLLKVMSNAASLADALLADLTNRETMTRTYACALDIGHEVAEHMETEERSVFPALHARGVSHEMVELLERDHATLRSMIRELGLLDPASLRAPRKLAHLVHSFIDFLEWHTQREEELALVFRGRSVPPKN